MCKILPILAFSLALTAAPIGNPSAPSLLEEGFWIPDISWANLQFGFIEDRLFQERFCPRTSSLSLGLTRASISGYSQIGTLAWNIAERLNLQIEAGSGQYKWRWQQKPAVSIIGSMWGGAIWSGSAKLIVFEIKDTTLAADAHAGGWDWMTGYAAANGAPLATKVQSEMRYWQFGAALSQKISIFVPYAGVAANRTRLKISKLESGIGWLRSRHTIGPFVGCTFTKGTDIALNVEWRGGFEQGAAVSGQIRF